MFDRSSSLAPLAGVLLLAKIGAGCIGTGSGHRPVPVQAATVQASATSSEKSAAEPIDWSAAAKKDVLAAYAAYVDSHPGMHDPTNPDFKEQLQRARDAALARVDAVVDRQGYAEALGAFTAVLGDGHAVLGADAVSEGESEWPGFVTAWRGKELLVHHAGENAPAPVGSSITSCNGLPIMQFIEQRLPTRRFRANEPGQWWAKAPYALISDDSTRRGRAERCTFKRRGEGALERTLEWTAAPTELVQLLQRATDGEKLPVGLSEPRPGILFIAMPTFEPTEGEVQAYHSLTAGLRADRSRLLNVRALVLDLRHNDGGNSIWPEDIAGAIWGKEAVTAANARDFKDVRVWWRVSEGNLARVREVVSQARNEGHEEVRRWYEALATNMTQSLARGEPFYVSANDTAEDKQARVPAPQFNRPVYVIVPGRCASACLDALDTFTRFPNVTLIGAPSSADSTYMQVRGMDLPSGKGWVVIPTKVYMNRPRKSGEVYRPNVEVKALDWSTETFLQAIQSDLSRRRRIPRR